jgi:hypothetical protein
MSETLPDLKKESSTQAPDVVLGFTNAAGFAMLQRAGQIIAVSGEMIPAQYRNKPEKCAIALEMANRLGVHFLAVMQNLYDVHGRPAWSSQFMTGTFNVTPGFTKLRYEFKGGEDSDDWSCRAWSIEKDTGERLYGSWISIKMAKDEGWYGKNGSKWKTMPEQMLRYRASAFFIRAYAPEQLMGLQTKEEVEDTYDMGPSINGTYTTVSDLNAKVFDQGQPPQAQPEQPGHKPDQSAAEAPDDKPGKPRATAAQREEVRALAESVGLDVPAIEREFNALSRNWSFAQCEDVRARASAAADHKAQGEGGAE